MVYIEIINGGSLDKDHLELVLMEDEPIDEEESIIAKSKLFEYTFLILGLHFRD